MVDDYIDLVFSIEKDNEEYKDKKDESIKSSLSKKYYSERVFNLLMERDYGFKNYDRKYRWFGGHEIEIMDLYKDNRMFAVKIGNSSAKLCFAIDQ
jgi:hypothetical protein